MQIAAQVLFHARHTPDRPALGFGGMMATFGMLGRGLSTTCAFIRRSGLPLGGIVAIDVGNPIHHTALILALELCGFTSLSIHTRHALALSGLIVDALFIDGWGTSDPQLRTISVSDDWFVMAPTIDPGLSGGLADHQYHRLVLSSGTTGFPKPIGYKPALIGRAFMRTAIVQGEAAPRCLNMLGFSTRAVLWPLFTLAQGGSVYFASADDTLSTIRANRVSRIAYVGVAQLEALVASAKRSRSPVPSLKAIHVSGDKLPRQLATEARVWLCPNLIASYASSEAGVISYGRVGEADDIDGAAGYVVPWVDVETTNADFRSLPQGTEGFIRVRTPDLAEYVIPPETGQLDPKGWFHTGDVGFVRNDGMLVITGRSGEVFNRRGIIVAPDYIETVVAAHPRVREAAAFVHVDAAGREEIWVAIVAEGPIDLDVVLAACRPALGDKTPDRLEQVETLPRTETGKIKRTELRQRYA